MNHLPEFFVLKVVMTLVVKLVKVTTCIFRVFLLARTLVRKIFKSLVDLDRIIDTLRSRLKLPVILKSYQLRVV